MCVAAAHWPSRSKSLNLHTGVCYWRNCQIDWILRNCAHSCCPPSLSVCCVTWKIRFSGMQSGCNGRTSRNGGFPKWSVLCLLTWLCCQVTIMVLTEIRNSLNCVGGVGELSCFLHPPVFMFVFAWLSCGTEQPLSSALLNLFLFIFCYLGRHLNACTSKHNKPPTHNALTHTNAHTLVSMCPLLLDKCKWQWSVEVWICGGV